MGDEPQVPLGRRAAVRLLIWGATGLSFLPGCLRKKKPQEPIVTGDVNAEPPPDTGGGLLERWAKLGEVWRRMGSYVVSGKVDLDRWPELKQLRPEMDGALDAVSASPELRAAFEGRWEWIDLPYAMEERLQREHMTCYKMAQIGSLLSGPEIEKQVEELRALEAEGTLSEEALRKAAAVLALHAEYLARDRETWDRDGETDHDTRSALLRDMKAGRLQPGPSATEAGERLAELTVDDLGRLAGLPQEGKGVGDAAPDDGKEGDE